MNILIVGSGAREHAIAKALSQSPQKPILFCYGTSNNPGIRNLAESFFQGDICDVLQITQLAAQWKIDLAVIGPEVPLEKGLADSLSGQNIPVIGPKKILAQIETSKAFTRNLIKKHRIPGSPAYQAFHGLTGVKDFLHQLGDNKYVIKADGLMGGKGVKVAGDHLHSLSEAYQFCEELHANQQAFVIEEKCVGEEFSFMCFCDGETLIPMPLVQDHKRAYVGDKGPNTGGMGSYSDANHSLPFLCDEDFIAAFNINQAVVRALREEYAEKYQGVLYGSFMATREGVRLIEFNARFGDPEVMNVLAVLESDLLAIFQAIVQGKLSDELVKFSHKATVCKYAVPEGYPDDPVKHQLIDVSQIENQDQLYLAAVHEEKGILYATGSRAAAVVGVAESISAAEEIAEKNILKMKGRLFHREDIGTKDLINRRVLNMQLLREI
jgi:phosphoribosylamine--glycine ligase